MPTYNVELVNNLASHLALAALLPAGLVTLIYGLGSPWWRSGLGRAIFAQSFSIVLVLSLILARRFFGDYPGYELAAALVYASIFLLFSTLVVALVIERRPTYPTAQRKAQHGNRNPRP